MIRTTFISLLLLLFSTASFASGLTDEISVIQKEWARIKYLDDPESRADSFEQLIVKSDELVEANPDVAEPLVWSAIVYSSYAGAVGGIQSLTRALPAVKKARMLLLRAETIDSQVLDGSVLTSLGALYYQVPSWPLGFGDKELARKYLEKAVSISENGLDANFFYGDFLIERKLYSEAIPALERALSAPPVPGRPVADQGRREEIRERLEFAKSKVS
jgi:tetratricopeptide (TPR) repeat protein